MSLSIDFSNLDQTLGAYCRRHRAELGQKMMMENDFMPVVTVLEEITDEMVLPSMDIGNIVKPWTSTFTPTANAITPKAEVLKVRDCKVDVSLIPQEFYKKFLATINSRTPKGSYDLIFEEFIMNLITQGVQSDLTSQVNWGGVYNPAGTTPKDIADGVIKMIQTYRTAGKVAANQIATLQTITNSNAVAELEKIVDIVPQRFWKAGLRAYMSPEILRMYEQDYRGSYGALPYNTEFRKVSFDGVEIELTPQQGLSGYDLILIAKPTNVIAGVDYTSNQSLFQVEKRHRALDIMIDFRLGTCIEFPSEIWLNDFNVYP